MVYSKSFFSAAALALLYVAPAAAAVLPRQSGTQFITGPCKADADCASGCCGFNTGLCAGAIIALSRDGGCGFGATPNDNAAQKLGFTGGITSASKGAAAPAAAVAAAAPAAAPAAAGTQFITGPCASDADCASGCCGFNSGKCAGAIIALSRDGGCGFGATPNDNAAKKLGFTGGITSAANPPAAGAAAPAAAAPAAAAPAKAPGTQFITGPCANDATCASGCCNFKTGLCAARLVALEGAGCGFGSGTADFTKPAPQKRALYRQSPAKLRA